MLTTTRRAAAALPALALALSACTMGHEASSGGSTRATHKNSTSAASTPGSTSASPSSDAASDAPGTPPSATDAWHHAQRTIKGYKSIQLEAADKATHETMTMSYRGSIKSTPVEMALRGGDMGRMTLRHIGSYVYLNGDADYWSSIQDEGDSDEEGSSEGGEDATSLAGRWVKMKDSMMSQESKDDLSISSIFENMSDESNPKWSALADADARITAEDVSGTPAYKIMTADGDTSVWVSADGRYNLLKLTDSTAGDEDLGRGTFSRWNESFDIAVPKGALDLSDGSSPTARQTT